MLRIEDSVIYQDVIAKGMEKGVKEGIEKGVKEGIEKGMEKGKSKGKAEVIIKLLKKKFNTLPAAYEEKLLKAKEQIIDNITEDMFDIEKIEDLDKYF